MMKLILIVIITYCCMSGYVAVIRKNGCSVSFPKSDDLLQPILLSNRSSTYSFLIPDGKNISLNVDERVNVLCSPIGNHIESTNTNLTSFSCSRGESFKFFSRNMEFNDIRCKSHVKGSLSFTNTKCGNENGRIINIGYQVTRRQFLTLIQTCYDSRNGNTLYTNHTVYGQAISAFSQQKFRPPFSEVGLAYDLKANELYKQKNQKQVLAKLLSSVPLANQYYPKAQFLSRGHLSPDADFMFAPMQFTTYFHVNICPQWQSINAGNWLAIESMVRKISGKKKQQLQVITGSHEVLKLPNVNNQLVEIYLDDKKRLPVPKYLWKIVYNDHTKEGIAFVAINNPFLDDIYEEDILCPDVCDTFNWSHANFNVIKKGYVYCCDIKALKREVPTIPHLPLKGILSA